MRIRGAAIPTDGRRAAHAGYFNVLIPLLLLFGATVQFKNHLPIFDFHVGDLRAVAGLGGQAVLRNHRPNLVGAGRKLAIAKHQALGPHGKRASDKDKFCIQSADEVHASGGADGPVTLLRFGLGIGAQHGRRDKQDSNGDGLRSHGRSLRIYGAS